MLFKAVAALAALTSGAVVRATTINITAGAGGLAFSPPNVTANVGDEILFSFINQHTVTQGTFATPCQNLAGGFDSGPKLGPKDTYVVKVNSTDPIWIHCNIATHCATGMVAAINAPLTGDLTFSNYQKLAEGKAITTTGTQPTSTPTGTGKSSSGNQTSPATTSKGAAMNLRVPFSSLYIPSALALGAVGVIIGAVSV